MYMKSHEVQYAMGGLVKQTRTSVDFSSGWLLSCKYIVIIV